MDTAAAIACGGFGAGLVLFSLSRWYWLTLCLLVPTGFAMMRQLLLASIAAPATEMRG